MKPLFLVLVALIILSCDTEGNIHSDREIQLELLNKNRDLWRSQNIDHYKFNQSKICFCLFENEGFDWSIEVRKGQDAFVRYNNNLIDALPDYALSIDQLFNQIESELNRNPFPHKIEVKYNSEYGFPEMFSIDIDELIADEEYSFINSEFKLIECEPESFIGKLVLKGICMNYVIEVLKGDIDQNLIENDWTNELTNVSYNNVFALGSYCNFPENLEEGDTFQFSIETDDVNQTCAVCEAYSPTPNKSLKIKICE